MPPVLTSNPETKGLLPEEVTKIKFTALLGVPSNLGRWVGWSRTTASSDTGKDSPLQARKMECGRGA